MVNRCFHEGFQAIVAVSTVCHQSLQELCASQKVESYSIDLPITKPIDAVFLRRFTKTLSVFAKFLNSKFLKAKFWRWSQRLLLRALQLFISASSIVYLLIYLYQIMYIDASRSQLNNRSQQRNASNMGKCIFSRA